MSFRAENKQKIVILDTVRHEKFDLDLFLT